MVAEVDPTQVKHGKLMKGIQNGTQSALKSEDRKTASLKFNFPTL